MLFSRALAAVLLANLFSLFALNALRLDARTLLPVWPAALAAACLLLRPTRTRRAPCRPAPWALAATALAFLFLTIPRLPYLAELAPGVRVLAQADDYGRLAELISLTMPGSYPVAHFANQDFLLSHYYAALLPMAWLKFALPTLTLKTTIVLGNALYHALFLLALIECAPRLARSPRAASTLILLFTLFGGFDLLLGHAIPFDHAEHWARARLGRIRELSSFYTVSYWAVHHMAALWAALLALVLARETRFKQGWRKPLATILLLAAALSSSPFVCLAIPLAAWRELLQLARRVLKHKWLILICAAAPAPALWLAARRVEGVAFTWNPPALNPLAYALLIAAVDLAAIPLILTLFLKRLHKHERITLALFWLFILSTWGLESAGYNNYMMRAALAPTAALFVIFARRFPTKWALALILAASITTVRESATLTYWGLEFSDWYWRTRGLAIPAHVDKRLRGDGDPMDKYNAERPFRNVPPAAMHPAERELLRYRE